MSYFSFKEVHRVRDQIWASDSITSKDALVLMMLASRSNFGRCWPSFSTIARDCRMSERSAQRAVRALIKGGYLEIDKTANKASNTYILVGHADQPEPAVINPSRDKAGDSKWKSAV